MSKALQVYDKIEEKLVDIPEDEVESVQNTRRIYFGIQQKVFEASTVGTTANISVRSFITGLLRYGKWQVENGLKQNPEHGEFPERIWESVADKINDIVEEITNSEDDKAAIAKFKKPYKQLSDAEKETLEEDLDDRYTLDAIAYCLICKALDLWTPNFWRLDAVAAKIAEVEKAEYEKEKGIAEKIQKNTSTMIPDQQFLSQEQVATTVLTLSDDDQAKILNGKIIPGDRVFYPVKSHIRGSVPKAEKNNLNGKRFGESDMSRNEISIGSMIEEKGALRTTSDFDLWIHNTGNLPNFSKLTELSRDEWDKLVDQFINSPAKTTQSQLDRFVPGGSDDPRKFKDAKGRIIIIGPALPAGKKISGHERAKVEVFRGALRPFVTTINQELSDVLKSNIRVFLILPGTVDGKEPNDENIVNTINYLMSDEAGSSSEVIFCPDETR